MPTERVDDDLVRDTPCYRRHLRARRVSRSLNSQRRDGCFRGYFGFLMGICTRNVLALVSPEGYLRLLNRGCLAGHGLLPAIKGACETRKHTFGTGSLYGRRVSYRTR